ncbi:ABC transporter permease [Streptomyces sp. NPDC058401]|uniref:ABC transporter permease n=1 Tax=Streptomyces sp. NPDC058401 TaxID=3346480 RepID=UPI003649EA40
MTVRPPPGRGEALRPASSAWAVACAVALHVGGIGVADTMLVSVPERRSGIGLRRAVGAARGTIRPQVLPEPIRLAMLGGIPGAAPGAVATAV